MICCWHSTNVCKSVVIGKESFFPPLLIEGTQIDQSGDLATKLGQIWLLFIPALLRVAQFSFFYWPQLHNFGR